MLKMERLQEQKTDQWLPDAVAMGVLTTRAQGIWGNYGTALYLFFFNVFY